jgi:hypothetical protein
LLLLRLLLPKLIDGRLFRRWLAGRGMHWHFLLLLVLLLTLVLRLLLLLVLLLGCCHQVQHLLLGDAKAGWGWGAAGWVCEMVRSVRHPQL